MSRYAGNCEVCVHCGTTYGRFRTGLTYRDVWLMFWTPPDAERSEWKHKRRRTVLGKWHQIKRELWSHHLDLCELAARERRAA